MSAPGRPQREYRSAQHEGDPPSASGRPQREYGTAQHEGSPLGATRRLIYLHGFNSSPQSTKARQMVARVAALPALSRPCIDVPALPPHPERAIADVCALIERGGPEGLTLIGSSLGGYYATWLAERYTATGVRAVLINPTTGPAADLRPYLGPQRNLYTGAEYALTEDHLRQFLALQVKRITRPERYYLMVQSGDEVLDYRLAIAHYARAFQLVLGGGDHAFRDFERHIDSILQFAGIASSTRSMHAPPPPPGEEP
jgi:predicted esterase YcpF (UPF0227 family)